jgi:hypothetical protein
MSSTFERFYPPALIFAGAAFFYWYSFSLPAPRFEPMGPRFFPQCILMATMFFCLIDMGKAVYGTFRKRKQEDADKVTGNSSKKDEFGLVLMTIGLLLGYILAAVLLDVHFLLITFIFLVTLGYVLSNRTRSVVRPLLQIAAGTLAAIYLVFDVMLQSFFP